MGPTYPNHQYSEFTAATYRRKHLNLLIRDLSEENDRVYGRTVSVCDQAAEPTLKTEEQNETTDAVARKTFIPLYAQGGIKARELAHKVRNRRTPSGNFVKSINASLFQDPPKNTIDKKSLTQDALLTTRKSGSMGQPSAQKGCSEAQHSVSPISDPLPVGTVKRSWLMPHQTGNRKQGLAAARAVGSKRTPIGAFTKAT